VRRKPAGIGHRRLRGGLDAGAAREMLAGQRDGWRHLVTGTRGADFATAQRSVGSLPGADARAGVLAAFKDALATRAYLQDRDRRHRRSAREVGEGHVSHRRALILGTTNSLVAYVDDKTGASQGHPGSGRPGTPARRSSRSRGRACWSAPPPGASWFRRPEATIYSVEAPDGPRLRGREGRASAISPSGCCRATGS